MEREYKWAADAAQFEAICKALCANLERQPARSMDATYFDTPNGMLRERKIGLRLRRENEETVCCMKLRNTAQNGLHVHEEYECACKTLEEGLLQLVSVGAPVHLCQTLSETTLLPIARVRFERTPLLWRTTQFCAEFCFDSGTLANDRREIPFCEVECEYYSGDLTAFESACTKLADSFALCAEPHSKLARALSL